MHNLKVLLGTFACHLFFYLFMECLKCCFFMDLCYLLGIVVRAAAASAVGRPLSSHYEVDTDDEGDGTCFSFLLSLARFYISFFQVFFCFVSCFFCSLVSLFFLVAHPPASLWSSSHPLACTSTSILNVPCVIFYGESFLMLWIFMFSK